MKPVSEQERNEMKKYLMIANSIFGSFPEENKKNIVESKNMDNIKKIKKKKVDEQFSSRERPVFGKNLKYIEKEKNDLQKATEDYENYIIWNGLKSREIAIDEISKRYKFNREAFKKYLIKKNLYDIGIPYRERK
jgi:hypothetical protein